MIHTKTVCVFLTVLCFLCLSAPAWAMEIYLTNGDKITGDILNQTDQDIVVKTAAAGEVTIDKKFIDRQRTYSAKTPSATAVLITAPDVAPPIEWKRSFSIGYTQTGGNTRNKQGNASVFINRKTHIDEATFKFDSFYSATNQKMDAKKSYGMLRYAKSFGKDLKWYKFVKFEGDQDRFVNIDYRLIPSAGVGYWFSDTESLKAMAEVAAGYQYTNYRVEVKSTGEPVLIPRFFIDKRLIAKLHLTEDFTFYPSLANGSNYRFRSETSLINQITERWAFKSQFIVEFNSQPLGGIKKGDYRWITSLVYSF